MKSKSVIFRIVCDGMLSALFVVLALHLTFRIGNEYKITLDGIPIVIGSFLFGPIDGMAIGLVGSFLEQVLTYGRTPTTIFWVLPAVCRGLFLGLFKKYVPIMKIWQFILLTLFSSIIVTAFNTFAMYVDSKLFHYFSYEYLFGTLSIRLVSGILSGIVYGIVCWLPVRRSLSFSAIFRH